jgi:phosphoribosylformimino-5-aminoimidazole carboxamide ribotide isomerase
MLLIPSIDLRGGRCVRLRKGDFATETAYTVDPVALAERYSALGARWLHVVDLDGAKDGRAANLSVVARLARHPLVRLQVGGGVRRAADIESLLSAGVARVVVGTMAAEQPSEVAAWLKEFGAERICVAFDVHLGAHGEPKVRTQGWTCHTDHSLYRAIQAFPRGLLRHVLCTDIERDGTLRGPSLGLYRECLLKFPALRWQASGGIRDHHDLSALKRLGVYAAVSGTALLEERISNEELRSFLPDASSLASTSAPT